MQASTKVQVRSHNVRLSQIGMVRDLFDSAPVPFGSKELPAIAEKTGMHPTTVRLQYYRWLHESTSASAARCLQARADRKAARTQA